MKLASNIGYEEEADKLLDQYERLTFEEIHRLVMDLMPKYPAAVLDVGSGTGRDAAYLANQGHKVVAVEPTDALRDAAASLHRSANITWVEDHLPLLRKITDKTERFDLVMMTAVWMHLDKQQRARAMPVIAALLKPGGVMIMNLRHGPVPSGRRMFNVSAEETLMLAAKSGLHIKRHLHAESHQDLNKRKGVNWVHFAFEKPHAAA